MARFNYDSFGNLRNASGTGASLPGNAGGDFRFQGQWLDEATGLYNFRARYYDPETGRFMSYDPIDLIEMEPESSNPYQFVYNNPHVYSNFQSLSKTQNRSQTNFTFPCTKATHTV